MKFYALFALIVLAVVSAAGFACGDDDDAAGSDDQGSAAEDQSGEGTNISGAIVPDTFLTYEGRQYELRDILQADLVDASEFTEAGEASEIDVDGDPTVYAREGDSTSVYTFFEGSGSGEESTPDNWYQWQQAE